MQTMNFVSSKPPPVSIRILLLALSIGSMIGAALVLSGDRVGFFYVPLLVAVFLVLRKLGAQERPRINEKAPGRASRPGA